MSHEDWRRIKAALSGRKRSVDIADRRIHPPVVNETEKQRLRNELDIENAEWQVIALPEYGEAVDLYEIAFPSHPDGKTYVLMRHQSEPSTVFVFSSTEWAAVAATAKSR